MRQIDGSDKNWLSLSVRKNKPDAREILYVHVIGSSPIERVARGKLPVYDTEGEEEETEGAAERTERLAWK